MRTLAEQKKTRLERAAEAWAAAEREREASPPDLARLREAVGDEMGAKLHELASREPRRSMAEEMEYLRLWLVYQAAKTAPLLEALSTFKAQRRIRGEWEMRCDTVFPGHRHIGDRLHWVAEFRLAPTMMMQAKGDWTHYALAELGEWLRVIERNLADAIGAPG